MAETNLERLKAVLDELFMFDRADLDFGLYRVMNLKRDAIRDFRDNRLFPLVREALGERLAGEQAALRAQIEAREQELRADGVDLSSSRTLRELRERFEAIPSIEASEAEVYAHLTSFFRRYYKEGDFISLRRYKEGVYAIPYEGEEVKLHWANADQYYIKTTEQFRDYTFLLPDGRRVHFKLVDADTPENNNRAQAGKDRRFVLTGEGDEDGAALADAVSQVDGELLVRFEYRPDGSGRSQKVLDALIVATVTEATAAKAWVAALSAPAREDSATGLLAKHVAAYTAKNTFDYFIHKDLGGFLRRELDFYLKNEVLHLDDIDTAMSDGGTLERHLRTLKAIRRVATPIIEFLASLEEFQKRLWLKQKFVVETHWCVTLDRVPRGLYAEVLANALQRQKWVELFAIDAIAGDMLSAAYSVPLTEAFLLANPYLVLDTSFFDAAFTERLLASIDDLDASTDGLLVHSENFQALNLMQAQYSERVQSVYIDPPYNTDGSPINYKNDYRRSSWASLIADRLSLGRRLMSPVAMHCATIDDYQQRELHHLLDSEFGQSNYAATVSIRMNPSGRPVPAGFAQAHEYAIFHQNTPTAHAGKLRRSERQGARYRHTDDDGRFMWELFRKRGSASERRDRPSLYYPIYVKGDSVRVPSMSYDDERKMWDVQEEPRPDEVVVYPIDEDRVERRWRGAPGGIRRSSANYRAQHDESGAITVYYKFRPRPDVLPLTVWVDAKYSATEHGTGLMKKLFTEYNVFAYSKSIYAVEDCLRIAGAADEDSLVLDYFAGSGTTGHAVINLNREDDGQRKYILVEMGEYFDGVLKPRILKAAYSKDWKDGKPVSREGVSQLIKVIRLESYEDTLNNLQVHPRTERQERLLAEGGRANEAFRDDYALRYWVEQETRGSASLLDITQFDDPWAYHLDVGQGSAAETRPATVDLVETFNYLIGLRVQQVDRVAGVLKVTGMLPPSASHPAGEKALILWRNTHEVDAVALDEFLEKQRINSRDLEYDVIYVNSDNHIENTRRSDETWKVRLIEDEFQRLMFETAEQERR